MRMQALLFVLLGAGAVALAVHAVRRWRAEREFIWRTESITARILRDDEFLRIGQFLNLDQELRPDESGWTNMKIDIPEHWAVNSVRVKDGQVLLGLRGGSVYALNRRNVGPLSFDVLDGGNVKTDDELERIWERYARADEA